MTILLVAFNFAIAVGYLILSVVVVPKIDLSRFWLKVSASVLFVTCSFTHAEMAANLLLDANIVHPLTFLNSFMQAVAVWATLFGLYLEFVANPSRKSE